MTVYLDSNGQPSATPTNESGRIVTQPSVSSWYSRPPTSRPVTIPVHGLIADTKYVFEWSSGNEFGLSAMEQFTLWTKKLEMLPAIYVSSTMGLYKLHCFSLFKLLAPNIHDFLLPFNWLQLTIRHPCPVTTNLVNHLNVNKHLS